MEELKKQIMERTGISDVQATEALKLVSEYLKKRLPGIIHNPLDKAFQGIDFEENLKSQVGEIGREVKNKADVLADDLKVAFEKVFKNKP
jgi:hypothetical protein